MTVGRFIQRGYVFQGRAFAGLALANSGAGPAPVVDGITTRLTLRGTAMTRLAVSGPSAERITVHGTSEKRLSLRGSSEP
jgi:hypothetical protein